MDFSLPVTWGKGFCPRQTLTQRESRRRMGGRGPMRCRSIVEYISVSVEYWCIIDYCCVLNMIISFLVTCVFSYHVLQFFYIACVSFCPWWWGSTPLVGVPHQRPPWQARSDKVGFLEVPNATKLGSWENHRLDSKVPNGKGYTPAVLAWFTWKSAIGSLEIPNLETIIFRFHVAHFGVYVTCSFSGISQCNVAFWIGQKRLFLQKKDAGEGCDSNLHRLQVRSDDPPNCLKLLRRMEAFRWESQDCCVTLVDWIYMLIDHIFFDICKQLM